MTWKRKMSRSIEIYPKYIVSFVVVLKTKLKTHTVSSHYIVKGQIISKGFLMSSISSKKRTKEFDFTTMIPQVDWFSFVFWRKSKTPKNHFEIN